MSYTVTIKTLQGASFDLQVEGSFTVKATKEKIATEHAELGSAAALAFVTMHTKKLAAVTPFSSRVVSSLSTLPE